MLARFKIRKVLTFGEPAVFTKRGVEKHRKLPYYRITHSRDVIACFFPGFRHAGTEIMAFDDGSVTIVPTTERADGKGLAAKMVSTMFARAARGRADRKGAPASAGNTPTGSLKGVPPALKAAGSAALNGRPTGSVLSVEDAERDLHLQQLLWEENRIGTYASLLKNPEAMRVVFFESKRNEM